MERSLFRGERHQSGIVRRPELVVVAEPTMHRLARHVRFARRVCYGRASDDRFQYVDLLRRQPSRARGFCGIL